MEIIENITNDEIVEKVVKEMILAERKLLEWNANWWEYNDELGTIKKYFDLDYEYRKKLEITKFLDDLKLQYKIEEKKDIPPIRTIKFNDKYDIDIYKIEWNNIKTNNCLRELTFNSNGNISLSKRNNKKSVKKNQKVINYQTEYNVNSLDFNLDIYIYPDCNFFNESEKISIELIGSNLIKKYDGIEIMENLSTGEKHIRVTKEDKSKIILEAKLNEENTLEKGFVEIKSKKGNGKINGTYRFDLDKEKKITANFYSRKGKKIDLTTNPLLLQHVLLLTEQSLNRDETIAKDIVMNVTNNMQEAILNNINERKIEVDQKYFSMENIIEKDKEVTNVLKQIKGEIPLIGLTERINFVLEFEEKKKDKLKYKELPKVLNKRI